MGSDVPGDDAGVQCALAVIVGTNATLPLCLRPCLLLTIATGADGGAATRAGREHDDHASVCVRVSCGPAVIWSTHVEVRPVRVAEDSVTMATQVADVALDDCPLSAGARPHAERPIDIDAFALMPAQHGEHL